MEAAVRAARGVMVRARRDEVRVVRVEVEDPVDLAARRAVKEAREGKEDTVVPAVVETGVAGEVGVVLWGRGRIVRRSNCPNWK